MTTVYYYSYNTEINSFAGSYPALKNPRRQSEYLLPSRATFKAPPKTNNNEIAIWNGENWVIEKDFRGGHQVNIETKEVSKIDYIGSIKLGFQRISEEQVKEIQEYPQKFKRNGERLIDISNTEEYQIILENERKEKRKIEIEQELLELDSKRIRAICEPSVKDNQTGETWLDYYNKRVLELRTELKNL